jgi:L-arabinose isomerase
MMEKLYFITGSQDLYGEATLKQVALDSQEIVTFVGDRIENVNIVWKPTVRNNSEIIAVCEQASIDKECVGVITWMHTFSPAKMWIKGLQRLNKPLLHLHTQFNRELPYDTIDMNFMNLNQSAHGDREYGFILKRLNIPHHIVVGFYQDQDVLDEIQNFARISKAIAFSKNLRVAMFGSNMREVAVTDGDRVESQIRYGWEVNYYGIGDLVKYMEQVTGKQILNTITQFKKDYDFKTDNLDAVVEQTKYYLGLKDFLHEKEIHAFTDTFEDLYGLRQLPGLATQRIHAEGIGFAAEGDYKTSALSAILMKMAEGKKGSTGFMEDYTYDFKDELVLAAHMLEVSPSFAATKPTMEVHQLGIGGKEDPARLVFDGVTGEGVSVCMIDLGTHFRLICAKVELIKQPKPMPKLPVARVMWKVKPNFKEGIKAWLEAGGGHHTVLSTALTVEDIKLFARLTATELVTIE